MGNVTQGIAQKFRVLGEEQRWRIVETLAGKSLTVSELACELHVSQSVVSRHLRELRAAGMVSVAKHAAPYALNRGVIAEIFREGLAIVERREGQSEDGVNALP